MKSGTPTDRIKLLSSFLVEHQELRKTNLNLVASENALSTFVLDALSNDLAGRYSSEFYGGSAVNRQIIEYVENLAKDLFDCEYACVAPISGNLCDLAALNSLTSVGDSIALVSSDDGGYPFQIEVFNRKAIHLPFNSEEWTLDYSSLENFYKINRPQLTILGASAIAYPYSIDEVTTHLDESQNIVYDGSHVLGLIAGSQFQNPFDEGIPILFGSTHKSFPGPQGGIIVGTDHDIFSTITSQFSIQSSLHPFDAHHGTVLVDNVHSHRIAALGFALLELIEFGEDYAKQIIRNTGALGNELLKIGYPAKVNSQHGISKTHQILMPMESTEGLAFKQRLEKCGIFVDAFVRIGTSELTRRGYKESDMKNIAELIHSAATGERTPIDIRRDVSELCLQHTGLSYCFDDIFDQIRR